MGKMSLEELQRLRQSKQHEMSQRETEGKSIEIIVGMGTSGIASGAKLTLDAFVEELSEQNLTNVSVRQTGSMGLDHAEPTVEVKMPGMPDIIYGRVDVETAKKIVRKHVLGKTLVNDHIFDRPAADINK
ncbi:MAG TPA: (2Fe-2S) ferredoxin domain-containing protein [Spirochaetia bacterium]|nr:(2Fe-2S) ferredoxin domain-containing protein [Spirochaetia bacterium]